MNWIPLLASVARLLDVHDSQRTLGTAPEWANEVRNGRKDGLYLDIATIVLETISETERNTSDEYVSFDEIARAVFARNVHAGQEDILYVLNVLRSPSELWYVARNHDLQALQSDKNTALIVKTTNAAEYKLSQAGRAAVALANSYQSIAYMEGDALKMLRAIEENDFLHFIQFADELTAQIRREILTIREHLEKTGLNNGANAYIRASARYRKITENTLSTVSSAEHALHAPDIASRIELWQGSDESGITYEMLRARVRRIRQVLEQFSRLLLELVRTSLQSGKSSISPPSFIELGIAFVLSPPTEDKLDWLLRQWGALETRTPFFSALDGEGAITAPDVSHKPIGEVFNDEKVQADEFVGRLRFVDCYAPQITEALSAGPLNLSTAIDNGWFIVGESEQIADLIGVFTSPAALKLPGVLEIRLQEQTSMRITNDGTLLFNDLELRLT
jgi:hypothetical protein